MTGENISFTNAPEDCSCTCVFHNIRPFNLKLVFMAEPLTRGNVTAEITNAKYLLAFT